MAADPPVLINGYWIYLRAMVGGLYGSSHLNPSEYQKVNAYEFRQALLLQGYDDKAIAGVLGCAQVESGLSPGAIQKVSALPNGAEHITDVPNSYMMQYYTPTAGGQGYGLGLLQWDRYSTTWHTNDLLGYLNAQNIQWYEGAGQAQRLEFEFNNDSTYHFWHLNYGSNITWAYYKQIGTNQPTWDAGECANVWTSCWELSSLDPTGRQYRRDNANYWYEYFNEHPDPPEPPEPPEPPVEPNFHIWMLYKFRQERRGVNVKTRNILRLH